MDITGIIGSGAYTSKATIAYKENKYPNANGAYYISATQIGEYETKTINCDPTLY